MCFDITENCHCSHPSRTGAFEEQRIIRNNYRQSTSTANDASSYYSSAFYLSGLKIPLNCFKLKFTPICCCTIKIKPRKIKTPPGK